MEKAKCECGNEESIENLRTDEDGNHTCDKCYIDFLEDKLKEGEKDSEDLALKFADWIHKGNWRSINLSGTKKFIPTEQLLQIFKQEQQKTGNNG